VAALSADGIRVHFAGVRAVDGVDFRLEQGEILGLIGPNGAGKTTLVNALSGFQKPTAGTITLAGQDVTGWAAHRRARLGLARSFQSARLFPRLTVFENVECAALGRGTGRRAARRRAEALLREFDLWHWAHRLAADLPLGDERRVGVLRVLATEPAFVLLDEPAAGLNETESAKLGEVLAAIRSARGCGVCLIEHDLRLIMSACERIQVLAFGETLAIGPPAAIRRDPAVIEAYLGEA
jgi:branched-chain amino acid transport system ATP-binding protein